MDFASVVYGIPQPFVVAAFVLLIGQLVGAIGWGIHMTGRVNELFWLDRQKGEQMTQLNKSLSDLNNTMFNMSVNLSQIMTTQNNLTKDIREIKEDIKRVAK